MPIRTQPFDEPTLNLTPMIDVILVLIIFFMVATRFAEEERKLDLHIPTIGDRTAPGTAPDPKVVHVQRDGAILLSGQHVTLTELIEQLSAAKERYKRQTVLIRADEQALHGRMTSVYDACRQAGISNLAVAVKLEAARTK